MRAIVLDDRGPAFHGDRPEPTPAAGEVLVRVLRAGICETDVQLILGYKPFRGVLGHEFVGIAETGPLAGRRVVSEINCSCGQCDTCRAGRPTHCPSRTTIGINNHDGAFADLIAVPQVNLHAVPDTVPTDAAVFTEPVAAAFQIPAQIQVRRNDRVVVLGDGRLGNLCAQVLARMSDDVLVVGKHRSKLSVAASLGLATCIRQDVPPDRTADLVVDCTGSAAGLPDALGLVRPRGTIVLKTTVAEREALSLAPIVIDEVTIVGSRCGPFDRALAALASGEVSVLPLVSERFPLPSGVEALERTARQPVLKVLLDVAGD